MVKSGYKKYWEKRRALSTLNYARLNNALVFGFIDKHKRRDLTKEDVLKAYKDKKIMKNHKDFLLKKLAG